MKVTTTTNMELSQKDINDLYIASHVIGELFGYLMNNKMTQKEFSQLQKLSMSSSRTPEQAELEFNLLNKYGYKGLNRIITLGELMDVFDIITSINNSMEMIIQEIHEKEK